jgi:alpha-1,6-mannosyltransferase
MSIDVAGTRFPWIVFWTYIMGFMVYAFIPAERNAHTMQVFLGFSGIHALCGLFLLRSGSSFLTLPRLFSLFLLSRLAVFFMYPWLSDDVFGYLFYGKATLAGVNLYALKADDLSLTYLRDSAYALMAFKPYQNIYPPIATIFMSISAWISSFFPYSLQSTLFIWKALLFCSEFIGLALLYHWLRKYQYSLLPILLYLAIPMTAIEGIGQAHNEVLLLPFIIGSIMLFRVDSSIKRSILIGILCAVLGLLKLYPIVLIIPFLLHAKKSKNVIAIFIGTLFMTLLATAPWFWGIVIGNYSAIQGYASVLNFYQGTYFNGVILYGIRHILELFKIHEWWLLAPKVLTIIRGIGVMIVSGHAYIKKKSLIESLYMILLVTILISAKVHPWYFIPVMFLGSIFQRQSIAIISSLMMFTYAMYAVDPAHESMLFETILWSISGLILIMEYRHSLHIFNRDQSKILT